MLNLIVVDNPKRWPLHIPDVPVVAARSYLTDSAYSDLRKVKVFNLCRSYRYQSMGYYVSLLATARGHKPLPDVTTIQDLKTVSIVRTIADDLDALVQRCLHPIKSDEFTLSIYFGQNTARRYAELAARLFRLFPAPLLRATFAREDDEWTLASLGVIPASDVSEAHHDFLVQAATEFFAQNRLPSRPRVSTLYDLAILHDPDESPRPSNSGALKHFMQAARRMRLGAELIERDDYGRLSEFDALFIRETTAVQHHTYRFARKAAAEGLVVIDDPDSIARCSNKVYLAELLARNRVSTPRTLVVHRDNRDAVLPVIGLPCVLKQPDSSFSQGVIKADDAAALNESIDRLLERSDLIIAQQFLPTEFDWRIGVLDREPLFAARYHMVPEHWQIAQNGATGTRYGNVEAVPIEQVPSVVVNAALRASRLIGHGLYGVDVKQAADRVYVIEINDNPNIDAGFEDAYLKQELYDRVMRVFLQRLQQRRNGGDSSQS